MTCLLCGSRNTEFVFIYRGKDIYLQKLGADKFKVRWFSCYDCGVYFSKQHENIEDVYADDNLYDAQYDLYGIKDRFCKIMHLKKNSSDNASRIKRIKDFHRQYTADFKISKSPYNVLDVGAGLGVFTAGFAGPNYRCETLEINPVAVRHLREELSMKVYTCGVEKLKIHKGFDLITLNKVVEHIKRPFVLLNGVRRLLRDKGIIYIELPDSIGYEAYGPRCDAFASGHYMVYNSESIFYLMKQSRLEIMGMHRLLEPSGKRTICVFARRG